MQRSQADRLVEKAVSDLRSLILGGQLELAVRVGEYVIEHFYGSAEAARAKSSKKAASLRRLAERAPEFGMTSAGVARAVPIALQVRELGRPIALRLSATQHRALLPVRDPAERRLLAEAAISARWSAEDIRTKAGRLQKRHAGGRPATPPLQRIVERASRLFGAEELAENLDARALDRLAPGSARRLLSEVTKISATLQRIERLLMKESIREARDES